MTTADSQSDRPAADSASYAPFAQLAKMLVPSSGCVAVYAGDGDLVWCSDGYERPDLRELIDELRDQTIVGAVEQASVRKTSTGITAMVAPLLDAEQACLGYMTVELGAERAAGNSMATSLLRPLVECVASRMSLERTAPTATTTLPANDLDFLIGVSEVDGNGRDGVHALLERCVDHLDCECAALVIPSLNLTAAANRVRESNAESHQLLDRTQKHLLAWAQLNNRPMVVNRVGGEGNAAQYKILSCPIRDESNAVTGLIALFRAADGADFEARDVHILEFLARRAIALLRENNDPLTGLMNRRTFEDRLQSLFDGTAHADSGGFMLHLDIDRLQAVNDAFGLEAGDEVIQRLAGLVKATLGPEDLACRIAGDRFALYLRGREESEAVEVAETLCRAVSQLGYLQDGESVAVSISAGLAEKRPGVRSGRHLLAVAELACKRARQDGGNRHVLYTPSTDVSPAREVELIAAAGLQHALKGNDFRLLAQPIVALAESDAPAVGYEALVRMRDSTGSLVSPDRFLAAARRYRLLPAVDAWVFAALIRELDEQAESLEDLPLGLGVNVSEQSLLSRDYARSVLAELERTGLPGSLFCFEIGESAALSHIAEAADFIAAVREAGCLTALDDFGSGLTSFAHLRRLQVDTLKFDGALVRGILQDRHLESMVVGLASAAASLGLRVVAEHVETPELAARIREIGIPYAQGFEFGQPVALRRALPVSRAAAGLSAGF